MDGNSLDIKEIQLEKLRKLFPETISEGKVDWEKLKAILEENITFSNERYVLNWAGKSDAFKVLQSPTTATLVPVKEESVNFNNTEHIFIEGENLEVLKVLQKSYYGKVKMIYIDPPYNSGNEHFIYPDRFSESKEDYLKRVGEKNEEGFLTREGMYRKNSRDSGHYHSNWLNMMYSRLFLARNMLKDDGVIFVSIDDNEVHNLRLLMNEIFGENNFIESIIWKNKYGAGAKTRGFISNHEYILCYSKNPLENIEATLGESQLKAHNKKDEKYSTRGPYRTQPVQTKSLGDRPNLVYSIEYDGVEIWPDKQWVWSKERMLEAIENNEVEIEKRKDGTYSVRSKQYLKDENGILRKGKPLSVMNGPFNQEGTTEMRILFGKDIFPFPKPPSLIKYLFDLTVNEKEENEEIYLDFFAGSAPSAQAILELNKEKPHVKRKFVCVQLSEKTDEKSEAYKAGYKTIADIAKERIRRVIKKIENEQETKKKEKAGKLDFGDEEEMPQLDLGFKVFKLQSSNFKIWRRTQFENDEQLTKQLEVFTDPTREGSEEENMLYELLLKSGFDLYSRIEHKGNFYVVNSENLSAEANMNAEMIVALSKISETIVKEIVSLKPQKCIVLDKLFNGNDQLKTNTVLQMRDTGVDFKTI
jgi:adenine-specific DNA-methyltransferase